MPPGRILISRPPSQQAAIHNYLFVLPVVRLPVVEVFPLRFPAVLPVPVPVPVPRFVLPLFMFEPLVPLLPMLPDPLFVFIIGVGDIMGVLMVFRFEPMFALRAFTFTFVLPESPQPNVPAAIKNEAVIMVFLMV
jgi:hypothetical protein